MVFVRTKTTKKFLIESDVRFRRFVLFRRAKIIHFAKEKRKKKILKIILSEKKTLYFDEIMGL